MVYFFLHLGGMKKSVVTRLYSDQKNPVELDLVLVSENGDEHRYNFKCGAVELHSLILRQMPHTGAIKKGKVNYYIVNGKSLKSYHLDHIEIRYFLIRNFYPHDLTEIFYKTEVDISIMYTNFKKSLKPPFDKILDDGFEEP